VPRSKKRLGEVLPLDKELFQVLGDELREPHCVSFPVSDQRPRIRALAARLCPVADIRAHLRRRDAGRALAQAEPVLSVAHGNEHIGFDAEPVCAALSEVIAAYCGKV
jgi:hypothetical protein